MSAGVSGVLTAPNPINALKNDLKSLPKYVTTDPFGGFVPPPIYFVLPCR